MSLLMYNAVTSGRVMFNPIYQSSPMVGHHLQPGWLTAMFSDFLNLVKCCFT